MTLRPRWFVLIAALPLVLLQAGAWAAKPGPEATPAAKVETAKPAAAPLVLDGKTLFFVRERAMSFTPEDRAGAILRRLELFLKDPLARPETITAIEAETSSEIMAQTYSLLHQNIQDVFNEAGVEIMSPHYGQIRDGNKMAIPDSCLPPEYVPGSLRVVSVPENPQKDG